ncbi:MAG TPA: hypothetical protein VFD70_16480 [Anaerolineae bacterium]|nr:hypothetical protein [Anaerolineae bacterium]
MSLEILEPTRWRSAYWATRETDAARGTARVQVKDIELWWPRGYRESPLHDATLELIAPDDRVLDVHHCYLLALARE